jgi:hypothetical protein
VDAFTEPLQLHVKGSPEGACQKRESGGAKIWPELEDLLPLLLNENDTVPEGCDTALYLKALDNMLDLTPEAKRDLIHSLWHITETLIALEFRYRSGFGKA